MFENYEQFILFSKLTLKVRGWGVVIRNLKDYGSDVRICKDLQY